jgi:hypothetical protein
MAWPLIIGAALGAAKQYGDQREAARQRQVQSQIAKFSPWTGMSAESNIANPSAIGNVGGGALAGWQMGQSMQAPTTGGAPQNTLGNTQQAPPTMQAGPGVGAMSVDPTRRRMNPYGAIG